LDVADQVILDDWCFVRTLDFGRERAKRRARVEEEAMAEPTDRIVAAGTSSTASSAGPRPLHSAWKLRTF
jgi:hypothetical protein